MAIFTIVGLTLKEAWRKKTVLGALLLGALVLAFSLLLLVIKARMSYMVAHHSRGWDEDRMAYEYPNACMLVTLVCLFFIRVLGSAVRAFACGRRDLRRDRSGPALRHSRQARSTLANTARKVARPQFSRRMQRPGMDSDGVVLAADAMAAPYYGIPGPCPVLRRVSCALRHDGVHSDPDVFTVFQRVLGTSLTVVIAVISWCDGIFNFLGDKFEVPVLHTLADASCLLMPQGYVAWWIRHSTHDFTDSLPTKSPLHSSQFLQQWGWEHLHFAHLDGVYVGFYLIAVLALGILLFHRREIQG